MTTQGSPSGLRGCCVLWRWTSQLCKDPGWCCWALVIWIYSLESIDFRYFFKRACPLIIYSSTLSSLVGIFTKSVETWNPRPPASSRLSPASLSPDWRGLCVGSVLCYSFPGVSLFICPSFTCLIRLPIRLLFCLVPKSIRGSLQNTRIPDELVRNGARFRQQGKQTSAREGRRPCEAHAFAPWVPRSTASMCLPEPPQQKREGNRICGRCSLSVK